MPSATLNTHERPRRGVTRALAVRSPAPHARWARAVLALGLGVLAGCESPPLEQTLFTPVASDALDAYQGMTYGASWGDADGDGRPDLYLTQHLGEARLLLNDGQGAFKTATERFFPPGQTGGDKHGAAWADYDNDGDADLAQMTGAIMGAGAEPKRLFRNDGGLLDSGGNTPVGAGLEALQRRVAAALREVASTAGVDNPLGRTRMPLWFDFDNDGRLDLLQGADRRLDDRVAPRLFLQQRDGSFLPDRTLLPMASRTAPFCVVSDIAGDARAEVLCRIAGQGQTLQAFSADGAGGYRDLAPLPATGFDDMAVADFDGDGRLDLYLARRSPAGPIALALQSPELLIADLELDEAELETAVGFSFKSAGRLSVQLAGTQATRSLGPEQVLLGKAGSHPAQLSFEVPADFPTGSLGVDGTGQHTAVYLSQSEPGHWQLLFSGDRQALQSGKSRHHLQVAVRSTAPIRDPAPFGPARVDESAPDRLFMAREAGFEEQGEQRGLHAALRASVNVVAADFDNDGDVDLYVVASGEAGNQENLLLLNNGDGHFDRVVEAGGAPGGERGVGEAVAVADYDDDGFLDLLVVNGASMGRSLGLPSDQGNYKLYRNLGAAGPAGANHWLKIELVGTASNRDGIGARVDLWAGGRRQVRIQDGGVHHRAQNQDLLHFGLGDASEVERIEVHWPSGTRQVLDSVAADQTLVLNEP